MERSPTESNSAIEIGSEPKNTWGLWPTIGLSILVALGGFLIQISFGIGYVIYLLVIGQELDIESVANQVEADMDFTWICTIFMDVFILILIVLFIKLRRGANIFVYLSLNKTKLINIGVWASLGLLYCILTDIVFYFLNVDPGYEWALGAYNNTKYLILLIIATNVFAPITEEVFFRGFLFRGFSTSTKGAMAAVIIPSFFWSIIHVQYSFYYILVIFMGGILIGIARIKSKSLTIPIAMHFTWNLYATLYIMYLAYN